MGFADKIKAKAQHVMHHEKKTDKEESVAAPTTAPEPLPASEQAPAVPVKDDIVPMGVAAPQEDAQTSTTSIKAAELDTLSEPILQPPAHIAARLQEHRQQHGSKEPLTKEAIEADIKAHEAKKAAYQEEHHLPPTFDATKVSTDAQVEAKLPQAALPGLSEHEKQFAEKPTKEAIDADMKEHEARRQAILDEKSNKAGAEVLEAKKKAEEHNDGVKTEDGRDAPEQTGLLTNLMKTVGLA